MNSKKITSEDINMAKEKFFRDGGLIRKLPDEVAVPSSLVGGKYGVYESLSASDNIFYQEDAVY